MDPRPPKRPRTGKTGHHDPIPLPDDFSTIHVREGKFRRVGNDSRASVLARTPQSIMDAWEILPGWTPPDSTEFALDPNGELFDQALDAEVMEDPPWPAIPVEGKKKKSTVSRRPHVVWKNLHRQTYLDEILRWSGRADFRMAKECSDCVARAVEKPGIPEFRCDECYLPDLTCSSCCVRRHRLHPFHRIKKWNGSHFVKANLKSLGLYLQLNHTGMFCENPIACHASLLVLHTNGIHEVDIRYCGCAKAIPQHLQLIRRRLYPASQVTVKTCATFELLEHLHILALTTKASTYDFYRALEKSMNNTGMNVPKSRYRALFRMILQWRHLQMLKWAGRGNDASGVEGTQPGDLAIRCPSCPHPGINLSEGWQNVPKGLKFLYMLFICMDANFRLKNQLVSNYSQDPGLGIGWAYMVPRHGYEKYALSRANDADISTCVGFQALAKANTKFSVGLRYTGTNLACCGRSEMIFPCGVGNLQKGERYANMDYIFGFVLQFVSISVILISYDICCQWFVNLFKRAEEHWPEEIKLRPDIKLIPAIPKLHEPMHQATGHQVYSLNFIKGCGHSDCECPERVWGPHNALGNSTKTQGPGSRQDVLDDHFGFWNWLKYIGLGLTLLRRYKSAVGQRNLQQEGHRGLTESLDPELVKNWERICVDWEEAPYPKTKKTNPYHLKDAYLSEGQVKKELAAEEERRLADGGVALHTTSAWSFIQMGLDLEDTQRRLQRLSKAVAAKTVGAIGEERNLTQDRSNLRVRFRAWEQLVPIYMPGLLQYQADLARATPPSQNVPVSGKPEDTDVWLPSRLPAVVRERICRPGLSGIEERLRDAQCADSLEKVRRVLKIKSRMVHFKNKNVRGQRDGTRSRAVIDKIHLKARNAADRYRAARRAKLALAGPGKWEEIYCTLEDKDIRGYQDPNRLRPRVGRQGVWEDEQLERASSGAAPTPNDDQEFELFNETRSRRDGTGETRRTLSWIWLTSPSAGEDDDKDDILRVEWAKSRARAMRAVEEVMLLKEEMRRVLDFLEWKSSWWKAREQPREGLTKELAEGVRGFALTQSGLQHELANHFRNLWKTPLADTEDPDIATSKSDAEDEDDDDEEGDEAEDDGGEGHVDLDDDEPISEDELLEDP